MSRDILTIIQSRMSTFSKGQKLIAFDIEKIKAAGYPTTTAVLVTNNEDYAACKAHLSGKVSASDSLIIVE